MGLQSEVRCVWLGFGLIWTDLVCLDVWMLGFGCVGYIVRRLILGWSGYCCCG